MKFRMPFNKYIRNIASIIIHPKLYTSQIENFLNKALPYKADKRLIHWCYWDYLRFFIKYQGSLITDYFNTAMYKKSEFVRRESLANFRRYPWREAINDHSKINQFDDKIEFYRTFAPFINRKWEICTANKLAEVCELFINEYGCCFVKRPKSFGGKGVFYIDRLNVESVIAESFSSNMSEELVVEQRLIQCEDIGSFSPSCVNTMRIITLVDDYGEAHIAGAVLRMGRNNSVIDNFSSGGIAAFIDTKQGIIITCGRDSYGREYIFHPDTNKKIVGQEIDDWAGYLSFAKQLALTQPKVRYVGWDILKTADGNFSVIEGNRDAGVQSIEGFSLNGVKPYWEALLHSDKNFNFDMMH